VTGLTPTRYTIAVRLKASKDAIKGLDQEVEVLPPWWGDPMLTITNPVQHYLVDVSNDQSQSGIVFQPHAAPLTIELLDTLGNIVRRSRESVDGRTAIDTRALEPGAYVLRISRNTTGGTLTGASLPAVGLRLAPPVALQ